MQDAGLLDDEVARMLLSAPATSRERKWMAAALRRAADRLDQNANDTDRELGHGKRRLGLPRGQEIRLSGRIDGLRTAAGDLRRWAETCERP